MFVMFAFVALTLIAVRLDVVNVEKLALVPISVDTLCVDVVKFLILLASKLLKLTEPPPSRLIPSPEKSLTVEVAAVNSLTPPKLCIEFVNAVVKLVLISV